MLIICSIISRILYLSYPIGYFGDADESVFGLMALEIMEFKSFPIYCWEAHYAGAFVSYLAAIIFYFFGPGFVQLRLPMLLMFIISIPLFFIIYKKTLNDLYSAATSTLIIIFCPFIVLYYTMGAFGGYGETYLGSSIIMIMSIYICENANSSNKISYLFMMIFGLCCGLFFYILPLALPVILAFAFPALYFYKSTNQDKKSTLFFCSGGLIGLLPVMIYIITQCR